MAHPGSHFSAFLKKLHAIAHEHYRDIDLEAYERYNVKDDSSISTQTLIAPSQTNGPLPHMEHAAPRETVDESTLPLSSYNRLLSLFQDVRTNVDIWGKESAWIGDMLPGDRFLALENLVTKESRAVSMGRASKRSSQLPPPGRRVRQKLDHSSSGAVWLSKSKESEEEEDEEESEADEEEE